MEKGRWNSTSSLLVQGKLVAIYALRNIIIRHQTQTIEKLKPTNSNHRIDLFLFKRDSNDHSPILKEPVIYYIFLLQRKFDAPAGRNPVAIRMTGMGKGMIWVNGKSIGRHWMSYLSPLGQPTQSE